jgi:hypothetical protein
MGIPVPDGSIEPISCVGAHHHALASAWTIARCLFGTVSAHSALVQIGGLWWRWLFGQQISKLLLMHANGQFVHPAAIEQTVGH